MAIDYLHLTCGDQPPVLPERGRAALPLNVGTGGELRFGELKLVQYFIGYIR